LRNAAIIDNAQNFIFCFGQLHISFFLQTSAQQSPDRLQILSNFKQKSADVVDFFNREMYQDLTENFLKLVKQDMNDLGSFLPRQQSFEIINECYNYVETDDSSNVTLSEFINIAKMLLPQSIQNGQKLEQLYNVFTGNHNVNSDLTLSRNT
jgi:Ca2+-binding EF-hand superfamily protein